MARGHRLISYHCQPRSDGAGANGTERHRLEPFTCKCDDARRASRAAFDAIVNTRTDNYRASRQFTETNPTARLLKLFVDAYPS